jgi:hypothetical protein
VLLTAPSFGSSADAAMPKAVAVLSVNADTIINEPNIIVSLALYFELLRSFREPVLELHEHHLRMRMLLHGLCCDTSHGDRR